MITLRRASVRHHERRIRCESWQTFHGSEGYGSLELLDEARLAPGCVVARHPHRDVEIITYVREGSLASEDVRGRPGTIHSGEFQRITAGVGIQHAETNASRTEQVQVFQLSIRPAQRGLDTSREQRWFSAAQRRGVLCMVASPDGRQGSLLVHQNALMYSSILERGQHVVHQLLPARSAWIHVVEGEVDLGDVVLFAGDGAGISAERAASLTANRDSEVLLVDVGEVGDVLLTDPEHHIDVAGALASPLTGFNLWPLLMARKPQWGPA